MYRMMVADFNRLLKNKIIIPVTFSLLFVYDLLLMVLSNAFSKPENAMLLCSPDELLVGPTGWIIFILAGFTGYFVYMDFREGVIRNKIVAGVGRSGILASMIVVSGVFATLVTALIHVLMLFFGMFYKAPFLDTPKNLVAYTLVHMGAAVAIAIFFTVITYLFSGSVLAAFLPVVISVAGKIVTMMITQDLFPEDGNCRLTPTQYKLYNFLDAYNPMSYLDVTLRHGIRDYAIAVGGTILLSLVIGFLAFNRKDLK